MGDALNAPILCLILLLHLASHHIEPVNEENNQDRAQNRPKPHRGRTGRTHTIRHVDSRSRVGARKYLNSQGGGGVKAFAHRAAEWKHPFATLFW